MLNNAPTVPAALRIWRPLLATAIAGIALLLLAGAADAYTLNVVSSTDVGVTDYGAETAVASPDGRFAYVAVNAFAPTLSKVIKVDISGATPTAIADVDIPVLNGSSPADSAVSPDGAYVYEATDRGVQKIATADMSLAGFWNRNALYATVTTMLGAAISPDGQYGYFGIGRQGGVTGPRIFKLRLSDMTLVDEAVAGAATNVGGLLLSKDGTTLYEGNYDGSGSPAASVITRFDTATMTSTGTLRTDANRLMWAVASPDGRYGYFANADSSSTDVVKIDLENFTQVGSKTILSGTANGAAIAVSPDGTRLLTGNYGTKIHAIDTATMTASAPLTSTALHPYDRDLTAAFTTADGLSAYFATSNGTPYPLVKVQFADASTLTVAKAGTGSGTVLSDLGGIDCGTTCTASIAETSTVTLTAAPASGSTFTGWSGDCSGTSTCVVSMDQAHAVTATFTVTPTPSPTPTTGSAAATSSTTTAKAVTIPALVPAKDVRDGLAVSAGGDVIVPLRCPADDAGSCTVAGRLVLPDGAETLVAARFSGVTIASGATRRLPLRLTRAARQAIADGPRRLPVRLVTSTRRPNAAAATKMQRLTLVVLPHRIPAVTG